MYSYSIYTLVDISNPGNLQKNFPFTTKSREVVTDKETLFRAKNQLANFTTMLQTLQLRSNIEFEEIPVLNNSLLKEHLFGNFYENKQNVWQFSWQTERADLYIKNDDVIEGLVEDFNYIPINAFCKESVTFPQNAFITNDIKFKNTYFKFHGFINK